MNVNNTVFCIFFCFSRSNTASLEEENVPIFQQIYDSSQSFIVKSKARIISHLNACQPSQKHCNTSADSHVRMSGAKSAIQFHKSKTYPTSPKQYKSSVKLNESRLSKIHERALKCQDIPDERSKVTWV